MSNPEETQISNKLIICDNKYCQYVTEDKAQFNKLRRFLSYRTQGVEYTAAYKNGWDGVNYLLDKKGYFLSGLQTKAINFLNDNNIKFELVDKRKKIINVPSIDLSPRLKELKLIPRDYQEEIVKACIDNQRGIVRACTGSGKSATTALVTAHINKPTIIYVIGLDLLKQFHDLYSALFDEEIGFIGNGICNIQRINIASIWSIGRALKVDKKAILTDSEDLDDEIEIDESHRDKILGLLSRTKVHIFDESHVASTDTIKQIYSKIDPEYIYGFSGTPFRDDGSDLLINGILGEQIINVSASRLIKAGYLAQPIIKFVPVPSVPGMNNAPYQTVYKEAITDNAIRNNLIIEQLKELLEKKYTPLVLFKHIKHGEVLFEMALEAGINCALLHGNDSLERRTEVKEMLNSGKIKAIFASTIFDIGISIEILSALILAGGGKSSVKTLQRLGRILRLYPGKKYAAAIDFFDQVKFLKKHSLIRYNIYSSEEGFKVIPCRQMK